MNLLSQVVEEQMMELSNFSNWAMVERDAEVGYAPGEVQYTSAATSVAVGNTVDVKTLVLHFCQSNNLKVKHKADFTRNVTTVEWPSSCLLCFFLSTLFFSCFAQIRMVYVGL